MHWLLASVVISLLLGVSIRQLQRGTSWRPSTSIASGPLEKPGVQKTSNSTLPGERVQSTNTTPVPWHLPILHPETLSRRYLNPVKKDPFLTPVGVCKSFLCFSMSSHTTADCAEIKNIELITVYSEKTSTRKSIDEVQIFIRFLSPPHLPQNTVLWHQKICRKPAGTGHLNSW